jgi:ParB-like nuclease domain
MTNDAKPAQGKSWRDALPVHPAADLFPLMSPDELRELGEDIKKNGLRSPVMLWRTKDQFQLLDGRNRLDAMEMVGVQVIKYADNNVLQLHPTSRVANVAFPGFDPYAYVLSVNIHRRHLTTEQKREIIARVIKAQPEKSNRQIARQAKADHKSVARVRDRLQSTGEVPQLDKTTGADGKARPAKKKKRRDVDDFLAEKRAREAKDSEPEITPEALEQNYEWDDSGVASPEEIVSNISETIERHEALARAYKKVFKGSALNQAQKGEVSAAIGRLINTWQSVQRALARQAPPATPIQEVEPEITTAVTDTASPARASPVEIPDLPEFLRRTA